MSVAAAIGGTAIGGALGAVLARSGVCSNAAIRRAVFDRDLLLARIIAIAIVVQMALLPAAVAAGVDVAPPRLYVVAGAVGGFLFGIGMAVAGGCATGILWKSGTGSGAAVLAIAGFGAGELLIRGPLNAVRLAVDTAGPAPRDATLHGVLGLPYPLVALVVAAVAMVVIRPSWTSAWRVGATIGVIGVAAWVVADAVGYRYGLGFVGAAANIDAALRAGDVSRLTMEPFVALGVVVGAAAVGRRAVRMPDPARAVRALAGGLVMGVAGTIAHGCNIGHALTGVPLLSIGSIEASAAMIAGVVVGWRVLRDRPRLRGLEPR